MTEYQISEKVKYWVYDDYHKGNISEERAKLVLDWDKVESLEQFIDIMDNQPEMDIDFEEYLIQ